MKMAQLTRKWLDTPHSEIGCIDFVRAFIFEGTGKYLPKSYGMLSVDNYMEHWRRDQVYVERELCQALLDYGTPSDPAHPKLFDMLIVRIKDAGLTPAVYVGKGCAIASFIETGVTVFALDDNNTVALAGTF